MRAPEQALDREAFRNEQPEWESWEVHMFPPVIGPLIIDLAEIIRKLVAAIVRTGRLIGKSSGFDTSGDLVDEENYEIEFTKIVRRGVLCYEVHVIQTWKITTITKQPSGKVIKGPVPVLVKESVVSERQVECPPPDEPDDDSYDPTARAMLTSRAQAGALGD